MASTTRSCRSAKSLVGSWSRTLTHVGLPAQAVCVCRGLPSEWEEVRKMLADASFMRTLLDYDKDHVPAEVIARLRPIVANPDFEPENVGRQSKAARSLCMWVRAVYDYNAALKVSSPAYVPAGCLPGCLSGS